MSGHIASASSKTEAAQYKCPYTVWNSKDGQFYVYDKKSFLKQDITTFSRLYFSAVIFADKPIKPFFDLDIDVSDGIDGKVADDVFNRVMNVSTYVLETLDVPDEYIDSYWHPDCLAIATDHRPSKFSYAIYYKNIHFKNRECLKAFYEKVEEELTERGHDDCLKYFDKPSSNFRLVGCYKDDHVRKWQTKDDDLDTCFPHILAHNSHLVEIEEPTRVKAEAVELTDETESQVIAICDNDEYLTQNFTYSGMNYNNFQFRRIQSAYCDLCESKHDSQNAYVVVQGTTVYRKCYQDSSKSIRMGVLETVIPDDVLNTFIEDKPKIELPKAAQDDEIKLNYYSDAQYLYGKDWTAETIHKWFKKCVIKVRRTGRPAWVYIDKNSKFNSLKINLLEQVPWKTMSESRIVKIDGEDYDLAKYLCDFSKRPGNSYDDVITYPYLFESDKPDQPDKLNLFPGFPFKYVSDSKNVPYHWIEHLKLIDNGSETLLDWIAHAVQKPFQKSFAVFMMGKKGTGKSLIYDMVSRMLGKALTLQLSDINHICGSFNDSLLNKLFVNLNETTHLTKQHENILKSLITETELLINAKNQAAYTVDNYARFMITTNEKFGMRVSRDDRRGYYIETPAHQKNIKGYFDKMIADTNDKNNDEPFRLLFNYFANRDISKFNVKKPPMTKFKWELMKQSDDPVNMYISDFLEGDRKDFLDDFDCSFNEDKNEYYVKSKSLYSDFKRFMDDNGEHRSRVKSNTIFKTKLQEIGIETSRRNINGSTVLWAIINIEHVKDKLKQ